MGSASFGSVERSGSGRDGGVCRFDVRTRVCALLCKPQRSLVTNAKRKERGHSCPQAGALDKQRPKRSLTALCEGRDSARFGSVERSGSGHDGGVSHFDVRTGVSALVCFSRFAACLNLSSSVLFDLSNAEILFEEVTKVYPAALLLFLPLCPWRRQSPANLKSFVCSLRKVVRHRLCHDE